MNNSYITIIKEKRTALSRKRVPLNQNECTDDFRIGVPFEQNLQINCLNSFFKTRKTIHAEEKDIFYSAVLKIIKHSKPELAGFICACCDAEDIFVSLHCNAKNYIRSTTQDSAILTYFIMNTVHKDKRINRVQRTGLEEEKGKNQKLRTQLNRDYENSSIPSSKSLRPKKVANSSIPFKLSKIILQFSIIPTIYIIIMSVIVTILLKSRIYLSIIFGVIMVMYIWITMYFGIKNKNLLNKIYTILSIVVFCYRVYL